LSAGRLLAMSNSTNWRCTSPWRWLEEIKHWSPADKDLFFSLSTASQQASILTVPCPVAAARCSASQFFSNNFVPASASPSPLSVHFSPSRSSH
jgi:hypothetical protein